MKRGAAGKILMALDEEHASGAEMDEIRQNYFAVSLGERDKFCARVAAPVFSQRNRLLGALSFPGPKERFTPADVERMKVTMLSAARKLTREVGGTFPI